MSVLYDGCKCDSPRRVTILGQEVVLSNRGPDWLPPCHQPGELFPEDRSHGLDGGDSRWHLAGYVDLSNGYHIDWEDGFRWPYDEFLPPATLKNMGLVEPYAEHDLPELQQAPVDPWDLRDLIRLFRDHDSTRGHYGFQVGYRVNLKMMIHLWCIGDGPMGGRVLLEPEAPKVDEFGNNNWHLFLYNDMFFDCCPCCREEWPRVTGITWGCPATLDQLKPGIMDRFRARIREVEQLIVAARLQGRMDRPGQYSIEWLETAQV